MRPIALFLFLASTVVAQQPLRSGLKLSDFHVHDPFIVAHAATKTYYLYTAAGPSQTGLNRAGVVAYESPDLVSWSGPKLVFTVPNGIWANPADGAWAPEVHQYKGRYYLFITLHNNTKLIDEPQPVTHPIYQGKPAVPHMRGTQIFISQSPEGPFELLGKSAAPPADFMTLDGTLYVEDGIPYMIYAHEWIQVLDGTMEAIRLSEDLSASVGEPFYLFKASDAPWLQDGQKATNRPRTYVTDGPFLYKTKTGRLLMLWSSYRDGLYVETYAYSLTGKLRGPWRQGAPLVGNDSGHGMLFSSFDGKLMLILHQPFHNAYGKLFEMEDTGDSLAVKREIENVH